MISYAERTIVNGSLLREHLNKNVSIHVNVEPEAERYANVINAKTTDDMDVQIVLNEPLNTPVKGWVEIIGVPSSPTSIRNKEVHFWTIISVLYWRNFNQWWNNWQMFCISVFFFFYLQIVLFNSEEGAETFDKTAHNALVTFLNNCKDIFDPPQFSQF